MDLTSAISTATTISGLTCPNCDSHAYRKHGHCRGIQRYCCKHCGRCFKDTVNTPLHGIHNKQKMLLYISTMLSQETIRSAAARIGISISTSFSWRHRLLASLETRQMLSAKTPAGVCQINLPHSHKGKRLMPAKSEPATRTFLVADAVGIPCLRLIPANSTAIQAAKTLHGTLNQTTSVAIIPARLLTRAAYYADCAINTNVAVKRKLFRRAKNVVEELGLWMDKFHGVATKYLQQYWNWYRSVASAPDRFITDCIAQRNLQYYRQLVNH